MVELHCLLQLSRSILVITHSPLPRPLSLSCRTWNAWQAVAVGAQAAALRVEARNTLQTRILPQNVEAWFVVAACLFDSSLSSL